MLQKRALSKLYQVANSQQGFFTTKQALDNGFSARSHLYHVRRGNWIREHRGIYRLAQHPPSDRPDLIIGLLWSRNRAEISQGVFSHETALSLNNLSDIMPAKLHMTVPKNFRRNSERPPGIILHRANFSPEDVESIQGVSATKPLRTVIDLLIEDRVSKDILIQALHEGLKRGLITRSAINSALLPKEQQKEFLQLVKRASQ